MFSALGRVRAPRALARTLGAWALAALSAAAFSAPQLLPTAELARHALRARTGLAESLAQDETLNPAHQVDLFSHFVYRPSPDFGPPPGSPDRSLNPLILVLALGGLAAARRRPESWAPLAAGALGLLLALGDATPVYGFFYKLDFPGASVLKKPARYLFLTHAALALAGALAADWVWRYPGPGHRGRVATAILSATCAFSAVAIYLTWRARGPDPAPGGWEAMTGVWTVFGLALLLEATAGRPTPIRRVGAAGAVVGVFAALQHFWGGLHPASSWDEVRRWTTPPPWRAIVTEAPGAPRLYQFAAHEPFEGWPNRFAPFGVEEAGGFASLILERTMLYTSGSAAAWSLDQYASPALLQNVNARRAAAVGFVAVDPARAAEPTLAYLETGGFEKVYEDDAVALHRDPGALPRAYWVGEAETAEDDAEALARLADPDFPVDRRVLLRADEGAAAAPEAEDGRRFVAARFARPSNWEIEAAVDAPAAGWLVVAETAYPGWRAELDGEPVRWRRGNFLFRAVPVEAGAHALRMVFDPLAFRLGAWAFLAAWAFALAALAQRRLARAARRRFAR